MSVIHYTNFSMDFVDLKMKPTVVRIRAKSWYPSPEDVLKVNVDGSTHGNPGKSGMRGVIRNFRR